MSMDGGRVAQFIQSGIDDQRGWLDPLAERLQQGLSAAIEQGGPGARRVKDFLNGTWLGHPLHPVLTDAAIGGWLSGAVLDLWSALSAEQMRRSGWACSPRCRQRLLV